MNDKYLILAGKEQEVLYVSDWNDMCLEWVTDHKDVIGWRKWEVFHQNSGVYPFDQNIDSKHGWVKVGDVPIEVAIDWLNSLRYTDPYGSEFNIHSFPNKYYFRVGEHYNLSLYFKDFKVWLIADLENLHAE